MNRFSPEFAEKLRKRARRVGNKSEFARARQLFGAWVSEKGQNMMVINVFTAHYNDHMKPHYAISAQDGSTETYIAPESPLRLPRVEAIEGPPTLEEQAVERVRMVMQLINEGRVRIPDLVL